MNFRHGPGGPGPGPGGPGGPSNDPIDDPKFPRSFQMVPTYVVEHGKVTSYPWKHQLEGAIQNAYVELDGSQWFAPRDSRVALVNCTSVSGIDAPEGVTVSAVAAAGTTVQGAFDLPSGGKLIIA